MSTRDVHIAEEGRNFFELSTVIGAIAILFLLTALALPLYLTYIEKTRLSGIQMLFLELRSSWQHHYAFNGEWPSETYFGDIIAEPNQTPYIKPMAIKEINYNKASGFIFTFASRNSSIDGTTLQFTPVVDSRTDTVIWLCGYSPHPTSPNSVPIATTIPERYLPSSCKQN